MNPSSRTPEGSPSRCPLRGHTAFIEPSTFPVSDATCPNCGHLLSFAFAAGNSPAADESYPLSRIDVSTSIPTASFELPEDDRQPFTTHDRAVWAILAILSTLMVCVNDGFLFSTGLWLIAMLGFGQVILPWLFQTTHDHLDDHDNLYLGVVVGWALVPGPFVGVIFGTLLPWVYKCGLSSASGGIIGLFVGPCLAVLEGLIIVASIDAILWITTRKTLSDRTH